MVRLLIIADDFTGALDTGIQFAKRGIATQIFTKHKLQEDDIKPDTEVLVADTESRPLDAEAAYDSVYGIAAWAAEQGIQIIFKKTDSALRGNIGMELQAAVDAVAGESLYFLPGYPEIGRTTEGGMHYIQGQLLENSVFGKDPFEPVSRSFVPDIIKEQSDMPVRCIGIRETDLQETKNIPEIVVCDTRVQEDIDRRLDELINDKKLKLIAGCAALAGSLADKLSFRRSQRKTFIKTEGMYVACGSLNKITQEQVEYAEQNCGFIRRHLTMEQKLDPAYYETPEGAAFIKELQALLKKGKRVIVDTFDMEDDKEMFLQDHEVSDDAVRQLIAGAHGKIVKELVDTKIDMTVLMTGGDTLMGYMKLIGCTEMEPLCEIEQGVAASLLKWGNCQQQVLSKSGGFGTADILCRIGQKIIK